jgi:hypothetical protein
MKYQTDVLDQELFKRAVESAMHSAYDDDSNMVVGRIQGQWCVCDSDDLGRIAEMQEPTWEVDSQGPTHSSSGFWSIDENFRLSNEEPELREE